MTIFLKKAGLPFALAFVTASVINELGVFKRCLKVPYDTIKLF